MGLIQTVGVAEGGWRGTSGTDGPSGVHGLRRVRPLLGTVDTPVASKVGEGLREWATAGAEGVLRSVERAGAVRAGDTGFSPVNALAPRGMHRCHSPHPS